ncbi:MAG: DUF1444 family protein [Pirellulaceae bacterium]|nr:DUF1444 family protein [Pirellulaceae bacterium]
MDAKEFRDRVLEILRMEFPNEEFSADERDGVISWKEAEFGLHSLHTDAVRLGITDAQLREAVVAHFDKVIKLTELGKLVVPSDWEVAKERVRLQLMPAEFVRDGISVTYPLLDKVVVSVVIDSPHGYAYVRHEDLAKWNMSLFDLYEVACENLKQASEGIEISFIDGPPSMIVLQSQDGYDAARVLLPEFRQFAAQRLGTPFYAAIPNRDFLIMWAQTDDTSFHEHVKNQVRIDASSQSHPLTSTILLVTEEKISIAR